jgi:hypothetical protein
MTTGADVRLLSGSHRGVRGSPGDRRRKRLLSREERSVLEAGLKPPPAFELIVSLPYTAFVRLA